MNRRSENVAPNRVRAVVHAPDMSGANLAGASLARANLAGAILRGTNLSGSDLQGANLRKASLCEADLTGADLGGSNLGMADMRMARVENANLRLVNLCRANLTGARLAGACLEQADLAGAILPDGTLFSDAQNVARFTDQANPEFLSTLAIVKKIDASDDDGYLREDESAGYRRLPWKQFVAQTYGSLADDPIEWHRPTYVENEAWEAE